MYDVADSVEKEMIELLEKCKLSKLGPEAKVEICRLVIYNIFI
jgi:hypothetical protein